jgi:hypothetical protein
MSLQRAGGNRYSEDPSYTPVRYLRQDVLSMAKTIKQFQVDVESGKPDAKQAFEVFQVRTEECIAQLKQVRSLVIHNPCYLSEK